MGPLRCRTPEQAWTAFNAAEDFPGYGSASRFLITVLNERILLFAGGSFAANDLIQYDLRKMTANGPLLSRRHGGAHTVTPKSGNNASDFTLTENGLLVDVCHSTRARSS